MMAREDIAMTSMQFIVLLIGFQYFISVLTAMVS